MPVARIIGPITPSTISSSCRRPLRRLRAVGASDVLVGFMVVPMLSPCVVPSEIKEKAEQRRRHGEQLHGIAEVFFRPHGHYRPIGDRKSTRLKSSHYCADRMPSSA